jgi:hypothetical protein
MIIQRYFFLICSVLAAINVQSQINELTVEVRDNTASTLMEFANIFIVQCSCGGTTERAGIFKINLEENEYSIITSMIGYENDTTTIFLNEKIN